MAIGTTTVLNDQRYDIIADSLMLLGINEAGENIADADMQLGVRWLNRLVKQWETQGIFLNTNEYAVLYMQAGISDYTLGNETLGAAHWAADPIEQALEINAAVGATTLTIDSSVLLTIGDHIGIVGNDGTLQWTTVASKPTISTVTINDALLVASDIGNLVFSYTARPSSGAPLRLIEANILNYVGEQTSSILCPILSFEDMFQLTNRKQLGTLVNISYDKKIDTGIISTWLTPNNCATRLRLHYQRPIFDFTDTTSTQDLPPQYLSALIYNLAVMLAPSYGKSALLQALIPMAQSYLTQVETFDQENVSIYFSPTQYRY